MENPALIDSANESAFSNITLRDIFAGMAMHAFQANPDNYQGDSKSGMEAAAEYAYQQADAMLIAREGK
jgi:hypothetical protein